MKKTVTVNISGRAFTIDEDAYQLLDNYLRNLRIHFRKEEGASEIVADFEARIEELLNEKIRLGYQVINIEQIEGVIARMGRPADFSEGSEEEEEKEEKQAYNQREEKEVKRKFFRNSDDKIIGGVCSGIATYFGWDILAVRIIFIFLLFVPYFSFTIFYLIAWLVFPEAKTVEQKLQMRGKPITVENIGKTVAAEVEKLKDKENRGCLGEIIDFIGGFLKAVFVGLGCIVGLPVIFAILLLLVVLFSVLFGVGGGILGLLPLSIFDGSIGFLEVSNPILATTMFIIVLLVPLIALIYGIIAYFTKLKPLNSAVKWVSMLIWIVALVIFLCSGFKINRDRLFKNGNTYSFIDNITHHNSNSIKGNGIFAEKEDFLFSPIDYITIEENLIANLQIEQVLNDTSSILISGDENLVSEVHYSLENNELHLSAYQGIHFQQDGNIVIRIQTPSLKGIKVDAIGNVSMKNSFISDTFKIELEGAGQFRADSLNIHSLEVDIEGIASITLAGVVNNAKLNLEGAGKIHAFELLSDSVFARVDGIGSIECNPVSFLKGNINGIGKIAYKNEPKQKDIGVVGIGWK